jgi:hypothetical protein
MILHRRRSRLAALLQETPHAAVVERSEQNHDALQDGM